MDTSIGTENCEICMKINIKFKTGSLWGQSRKSEKKDYTEDIEFI